MNDDVGSAHLHEAAQTVVAVDYAAVKVVEVAGCESAAFERNEGSQIRRNDGQDFENHPFGTRVALNEALNEFQTLRKLFLNLLRARGLHLFDEFNFELFQVDFREQVADSFRAHFRHKVVARVDCRLIFLFREELFERKGRVAWLDYDVAFVVDYAFEGFRSHVEHEAEPAWHAFQKPNVRYGNGKFDMPHSFAAHAACRHFDAATVANLVLKADALVLAAGALVVAHGTEYSLAEQTAGFGLERAVVDCFGVLNLAVRPRTNRIRGSETDGNAVKTRVAVETENFSRLACIVFVHKKFLDFLSGSKATTVFRCRRCFPPLCSGTSPAFPSSRH